jgi:transposase
MNRKRRVFTPAEKAAAVRKHLIDKVPVSQIAEAMQVQPTQVHNWINAAMAQMERAFESPRAAQAVQNNHDKQLQQLQDKLAAKNEVIAELMEENLKAKKENGEP